MKMRNKENWIQVSEQPMQKQKFQRNWKIWMIQNEEEEI